jgi:hypothetical protein
MLDVSYHKLHVEIRCRENAFHCRNACFVLTGTTKGIQNMGQNTNKRSTAVTTVQGSICDRGCVTASTAQYGQRIICGTRPNTPGWAGWVLPGAVTEEAEGCPTGVAAGADGILYVVLTDEVFGSISVAWATGSSSLEAVMSISGSITGSTT